MNRQYINAYQTSDPNLYQALTQIANALDSVASASGEASVVAPGAASFTVAAAGGRFSIGITNPTATGAGTQPPIQHQLQSATNTNFDAGAETVTHTLGAGQTTLGVAEPQQALFWRLRSRYTGGNWNSWTTYSNASGVQASQSGPLELGGTLAASAGSTTGYAEVAVNGTTYKVPVYAA